jgi:hypothetical protein
LAHLDLAGAVVLWQADRGWLRKAAPALLNEVRVWPGRSDHGAQAVFRLAEEALHEVDGWIDVG